MTFQDKLSRTGPKRLLSLDGGGIRGLISLEVLAAIESMLQRRLKRGDDFVLADYFDYIAGTSTGGIIATCLAWGMRIAQVREFYQTNGQTMFDKASILKRFHYKYDDEALAQRLREVFSENGAPSTLGSTRLQTLLMLVMRNSSTDSPWPLCNYPAAKYNARDRSRSRRLQPPVASMATGACQYSGANLFPTRSDRCRRTPLHVCRWWHHAVQQSCIAVVFDGDSPGIQTRVAHW